MAPSCRVMAPSCRAGCQELTRASPSWAPFALAATLSRGQPRAEYRRRPRRQPSGAFTHPGKAGQNTLTFRGRLRARKLGPGRYRLRAIATDPAANKSALKRSNFQIMRG